MHRNSNFEKGDVRLVDLKKGSFDRVFNIETAKLIRWNQQLVLFLSGVSKY